MAEAGITSQMQVVDGKKMYLIPLAPFMWEFKQGMRLTSIHTIERIKPEERYGKKFPGKRIDWKQHNFFTEGTLVVFFGSRFFCEGYSPRVALHKIVVKDDKAELEFIRAEEGFDWDEEILEDVERLLKEKDELGKSSVVNTAKPITTCGCQMAALSRTAGPTQAN